MFNQLSSLRIDSNMEPSAWFEWIGPFCPTVKDVALSTVHSKSPTMLRFIPSTIQSLHIQISTSSDWNCHETITNWMKHLLKVPSSEHFPELGLLTISFSSCYINELERRAYNGRGIQSELKEFRETVLKFKEEFSNACEGVGVLCNLDI